MEESKNRNNNIWEMQLAEKGDVFILVCRFEYIEGR